MKKRGSKQNDGGSDDNITTTSDEEQRLLRKQQRAERRMMKEAKLKAESSVSWKSTALKIAAFFVVIGLVGSIPWILSFASERLVGHQEYFYYLWVLYVVLLLFILFVWNRKKITYNSFITQNMVWAIFTLGFYAVVDLPKYLQPHLRQIALWLWCSFTMIFNFLWFFMDDTDYVKEEAKEARREEKRKKKEDLRKQEELEETKHQRFGPKASLLINIGLYAAILILGGYFGYNWYVEFKDRVQSPLLDEQKRYQQERNF